MKKKRFSLHKALRNQVTLLLNFRSNNYGNVLNSNSVNLNSINQPLMEFWLRCYY